MKSINPSKFPFLFLLIACLALSGKTQSNINGNWSALGAEDDYSELFFDDDQMHIYSEIAGYIGFRKIEINQDSLITNSLNYKMNWINQDSIVLSSNPSTLYLKRIQSGFKLSDFINESLDQDYKDSFYSRMYKRKGINTDSLYQSSPQSPLIKEESIEIKKK